MDYYEILGVSRSASQTEIRNAYRKLAKQYHPDRNSSEHAKTYIQLINEAYETLSDEERRRQYDQPVFAFITEEPVAQPQKDPREEQRKENFRRWQERERIKREEQEAYKRYAFQQFKKYNFIIVLWTLLLVLDDQVLPPRTSTEEIKDIHWHRTGPIHLAKTESFVLAIHRDAIVKGEASGLKVESSLLFNIPLRVTTSDGQVYPVLDTIIGFVLLIPLSLLIFSSLIYLVKKPSNWATLIIAFEGLLLLAIVALWLISVSDRNQF